jgi:hypothetical protein
MQEKKASEFVRHVYRSNHLLFSIDKNIKKILTYSFIYDIVVIERKDMKC